MTRRVLPLLLLLTASGCGVQSPDLFAISRHGSLPGARATFVVTDDGYVKCAPKQKARQMPDQMLLDARELKRQAATDAQTHRRFPPRPGGLLSYALRTQDGTVTWSDVSRPLPSRYYRLALLTRQIAKSVCGLPR
jgi:hypothetical protein